MRARARSFGEYELHDLIALDGPQTVGVLVNVGKDTARVLTNQVPPRGQPSPLASQPSSGPMQALAGALVVSV
jgi:hypothetical protein